MVAAGAFQETPVIRYENAHAMGARHNTPAISNAPMQIMSDRPARFHILLDPWFEYGTEPISIDDDLNFDIGDYSCP